MTGLHYHSRHGNINKEHERAALNKHSGRFNHYNHNNINVNAAGATWSGSGGDGTVTTSS